MTGSYESRPERPGTLFLRRTLSRRRRLAAILLIGSSLWRATDSAYAADISSQDSGLLDQPAAAFGHYATLETRASLDLRQLAPAGTVKNTVVARTLRASQWANLSSATRSVSDLLAEIDPLTVVDARYPAIPSGSQGVGEIPKLAQAGEPRDPSVTASPERLANSETDLDVDRLLGDQAAGTAGILSATNQVDLALGQRQVYSDLVTLADRIAHAQRPDANAVTRYSTQSDGLNITQTELSQEFFFSDGASRLRPGLQYISYRPKTGYGVTQNSIGVDGSYRINDDYALSGDFWLDSVASANLPTTLIPTYDLFLTMWPSDILRVDLDTKREIFDNITSLRKGIVAETEGGSVDFTPTDKLRLTLRATDTQYSDSNKRQFGEAEAVWHLLSAPVLEVGFRASAFQFSNLLNDGYFNPNNYWSSEAVFRVQSSLTDDLKVELAASGGVERADPGGYKPLVKGSLQMTYQITANWTLDGGIDYFSSQESTSSGFARTSANVGLHYKFD